MENMEQERLPLPFSSFTTLRGKKGYPAEEVEQYCSTVNTEYTNLEQEYCKLDNEVSELALRLGQEQEAHRAAQSKADEENKRYAELNERYEALLAAQPDKADGLSVLERDEYQQCKEELEQKSSQLREHTQEVERLRTANEDFWNQITKLKTDASSRPDDSFRLQEARNKQSLLEVEQASLKVQLAAAKQEKEEFEEGIRQMNESMMIGQDALRAELRELRQQLEEKTTVLAEKEAELQQLKDAQIEIQQVSGEVVDENGLSLQQGGVPVGYASKYVDIFEIVRSAADRYAFETEEKMNLLLNEAEETARQKLSDASAKSKETIFAARTEADELLRESQLDAENISQEAQAKLESARRKADEIVRVAEQRATETLERAKREHGQIRALIKSASAEYQELSEQKASASEADLF